jgi:diguanylate cyclase (GGDEF)-like protein
LTAKKINNNQTSGPSFYDLLRRTDAFAAWLSSRKDRNPELFIALAEDINEEDRKILSRRVPLVIGTKKSHLRQLMNMEKENRHLRSLLLTDDLTGLFNRRFFTMQLKMEMARTRRTGHACCLIMIDFDNFKLINDTAGHDAGDRFLVRMGKVLHDNLRPTDYACRFGGDEFAAIMPSAGLAEGVRIAGRIQDAVNREIARTRLKVKKQISISVGMADYEPQSRQTPEEFFKQADEELYRAKREGKNRIAYAKEVKKRFPDETALSPEERSAITKL